MVAAAGAAFAYYAPALGFGFFNDDPTGHLRWLQGRSFVSLLTNASGHAYYRPFSFIVWQALYAVLGRHDPILLHLLNLLAHAGCAALVAGLGWRLTRQYAYALAAGLLFALFPFSYEAVPYVGSFVHPLVTFLILSTVVLYIAWRDGHTWAVWAAHVTLTLAVLTHENAVLTPLLLLALDLLCRGGSCARPRAGASPAPTVGIPKQKRTPAGWIRYTFLAEPAVFAVLWLLVPKLAEGRSLSLANMLANILPFLQALVYPVAPLARHTPALLWLLAAASLAILAALSRRAGAGGVAAWALLWWGLASLPAIAVLDPTYVAGSPRLFYLGSVGVCLLWSMPILAAGRRITWRPAAWAAAILILALSYLPAAGYMRCELDYQGLAGQVGRMMARAARTAPPGQEIVFVNLPYYFSSRGPGTECPRPYAFAPTGAVAIPPYGEARDWVVYNGGPEVQAQAWTLRSFGPGWNTAGAEASPAMLRARLPVSPVFVFDLVRWELYDLSAAWQPGQAGAQEPILFTAGPVQVSDFDYHISSGQAIVVLRLRAQGPAPDLKVFIHVYDAGGKLAAQDDSLPAQGYAPGKDWATGDIITDTHQVNVSGLGPGTYRLTAGMYNAVNGVRLEIRGPGGERLPDDEIPLSRIEIQ